MIPNFMRFQGSVRLIEVWEGLVNEFPLDGGDQIVTLGMGNSKLSWLTNVMKTDKFQEKPGKLEILLFGSI